MADIFLHLIILNIEALVLKAFELDFWKATRFLNKLMIQLWDDLTSHTC